MVSACYDFACKLVQFLDGVYLVSEKLYAHGVFRAGRNDVDYVAANAEGAAFKAQIVSGILDVHKAS